MHLSCGLSPSYNNYKISQSPCSTISMHIGTYSIAHILLTVLFLCPWPQCPNPALHSHTNPFLSVSLAADVHQTLQFLKAPDIPSAQRSSL